MLALGYADGWPRAASDHVSVALDGHEAPQVGRVSMDTVVLDLTDLPAGSQRVGASATVIGPGLPLERFAESAGTINYEILTSLSRRAKRVYLSA
ncbi:MAG: Alanine racemase, biosynthetic [Rhodospirillaceae bacterium]|nr:MAG: Alanine racemase, biosynthetic [Rhodospirillaceae bacterium]